MSVPYTLSNVGKTVPTSLPLYFLVVIEYSNFVGTTPLAAAFSACARDLVLSASTSGCVLALLPMSPSLALSKISLTLLIHEQIFFTSFRHYSYITYPGKHYVLHHFKIISTLFMREHMVFTLFSH